MIKVLCDYCKNSANLVGGKIVYPHRKDLYSKKFWHCKGCEAYVGAHKGSPTYKPLGRLANKELRKRHIKLLTLDGSTRHGLEAKLISGFLNNLV